MSIRILYLGEIVGKAGVFAVKKQLPGLRERYRPDLVVASGNGVTGGSGIGKAHSVYLRKLGIDVVTTGEGAFYKKDIVEAFPAEPWMLRPANHPSGVPGRGFRVYKAGKGRVAVVQLLGQAGFNRVHLDNPFVVLDEVIQRLRGECDAVVVEFRAPTTAEKQSMFHHANGKVAAVIGSYARTLTADGAVSTLGTAYITDAGMTGASDSVRGFDPEPVIREYLTGIPSWDREGGSRPEVQGCLIDIEENGKATGLETLRIPCKELFHDGTGHSA